MTLKVLFVSHCYTEPENQKNLLAISSRLDVMALVPMSLSIPLFDDYRHSSQDGCEEIVYACRTFGLSSSQYVFLTTDIRLKGFYPDIIIVEHNPWSLTFAQVWLYKVFFLRAAKLVCLVKKNTYRRYDGVMGNLKDWLADFLVGRVDHFIAASQKTAVMLNQRFGSKIHIASVDHHLGVDVDLFCPETHMVSEVEPDKSSHVVIGYCGRFDEDKGVIDLIEAVRRARDSTNIEIVLSVIGRGPLDDHVRKLAAESPWIAVKPPVPHSEVASFLQRLDIFVLPSKVMPDHEEHDAHALLEALSCGVACIATDVGINGEIIRGGNGLLVPGGKVDALVGAIERLVRDPAERMKCGHRAREVALVEYSTLELAKRRSFVLEKIAGG